MPFKIGQKIKAIETTQGLVKDREYVVIQKGREVGRGENLYTVKEVDSDARFTKFERRFIAVEEAPAIMAPGVKMVVLEGHRASGLRKGKIVTIRQVYDTTVSVEEFPAIRFKKSRFEIVGAKKKEIPLQVGDKVYITDIETDANPYRYNHEMRIMLNDGVKYTVKRIEADNYNGKNVIKVRLEEVQWSWVPENFTRVNGVPIGKKESPKAPPKPAEPALPEIIKQMHDAVKNTTSQAICSYAIKRKGQKYETQISPACYAQVGYGGVPLEAFVISMRNPKNRLGKKEYENYLKWFEYVYKDSPWRDVFHQVDIEEAIREGISFDVSKPISQIIGAAIAIREGHEYYDERVPTFLHFVEHGYGKNTAFLMASLVRFDKDKFHKRVMGRNHDVLSGKMNYKDLIKFFQQGYHVDIGEKPANEKMKMYAIFKSIADCAKGEDLDQHFAHNTKAIKVGQGWGAETHIDNQSVYDYAEQLNKQIN